MQGIDVNCFDGVMHIHQFLPASPGWFAVFSDGADPLSEAIAAFGLVHGPGGRGVRLVGFLGGEKKLIPVDCFDEYLRTEYRPCSRETTSCERS